MKLILPLHKPAEHKRVAVNLQKELAKDKFARFALRYNSMLYLGIDIARQLDDNGCERFEPDAAMANGRLAFARHCFEQALSNEQPVCTGEIPEDTFYASRKYARYFVIIEGAWNPKKAGIAREEFLGRIRPFVMWMFDRIEAS